jgi:uncharacterized OB-fold protein
VIHLASFFERARAGELTGLRCTRCGELAVPPRAWCSTGHEGAWEPVPLSGEGTIASFTVIRVTPDGRPAAAPHAVAAVHLREGVSLLGRVVDIPLERLAVGLSVRFRPLVRDGETGLAFGPVAD